MINSEDLNHRYPQIARAEMTRFNLMTCIFKTELQTQDQNRRANDDIFPLQLIDWWMHYMFLWRHHTLVFYGAKTRIN